MKSMSVCPKCKRNLPDSAFYKPQIGKSGHKKGKLYLPTSMCRECHNKQMRDIYFRKQGPNADYRKGYGKSQRNKNHVRNSQQRLRFQVLCHYGGNPPKCACCGESNSGFLTLDHINNDGNKDRALHGYGPVLNMWIIKNNFPEGYQVLCYNCNCGKARNKGVCPHKTNIVPQKIKTTSPSTFRGLIN